MNLKPLEVTDNSSTLFKQDQTKRQYFFIGTIIFAVILIIAVKIFFIYSGGHQELKEHLVDFITDIEKEHFQSFKFDFNKTYANETEEQYRLEVFTWNYREAIKRTQSRTNSTNSTHRALQNDPDLIITLAETYEEMLEAY